MSIFSRYFLGCMFASALVGISYYFPSKDESLNAHESNSKQTIPVDIVKGQDITSSVSLAEKENSQATDQKLISQSKVDLPPRALPMETMISNLMAERQRQAKEAVDLNPFGSNLGDRQ